MQALAKDPRYQVHRRRPGPGRDHGLYPGSAGDDPRELPRAFNTLVRGNLEVKRLPPEEEPGAPGAYGGAGSIDGTIPGKFWINLRTTDLHSKYSLPDLAAHEAIPGHVWQGEYANKLPLIRTMLAFNAYSEGWALYAEQLVDELGVYDDFPVGRLGYLQSIAFRACRLVVDTGLHAKRWSREQGVAVLRRAQRLEPARSRQRSRSLLQLAGPGLRLQGRPHRNHPPAWPRQAALGAALRSASVRRRRRDGRQRPDGRPGQECRSLHRAERR